MKIGVSLASIVMAVALLLLAVGAFGSGNMYYFLGGALTITSVPFFILGILGIISACKTPKNPISDNPPQ